ncbi:MAG: gluconate 2-dehydrogenase subunit 3 family protein [Woeseiaceae bacterium]
MRSQMPAKIDKQQLITRREAILRVSALFGGVALVGQSAMLAGCTREKPNVAASLANFSADDIALLDEIAETILPETATPGAKAAGVGPFIAMMVADTYDDREQQVFREGMQTLDTACREMHGDSFMSVTPAQRLALLEKLDAEQMKTMNDIEYMSGDTDEKPAHYFRMMKELALLGYFTSEIGYTQAMRYAETPGKWDPCAPYAPGEKAWAPHA